MLFKILHFAFRYGEFFIGDRCFFGFNGKIDILYLNYSILLISIIYYHL